MIAEVLWPHSVIAGGLSASRAHCMYEHVELAVKEREL